MKEKIFINKIDNHNCDGLCSHRYCGEKTTHYFIHKVNEIELLIPLCKSHADIIENSDFIELTEPPVIECERFKDNYRFYCVYCGKYHNHGMQEGHRCSHCVLPSPYKKTGYYIKLKRGKN